MIKRHRHPRRQFAPLAIGLLAFALPPATLAQAAVDPALPQLLLDSRGQGNRGNVARELLLACLQAGNPEAGLAPLAHVLRQEAATLNTANQSSMRLNALLTCADALRLLAATAQAPAASGQATPDTLAWLFDSNHKLEALVENLTPQDNWPAVLANLDQLARHDPRGRDAYFALILALAVVWDQPRPPLHHQMGPGALTFQADLPARYDYFKTLYATNQAAIPYARLSVSALTLVVDTPVPLAELLWTRNNVRGSLASWDKKFREIAYDNPRLERGAYVWPHGPYTLAAIRQRGGICVDQAYYATLTARAAGIPAMIFTGSGRRGPHAWFGYMKSQTNWEMDIGRYDYDKYATGHTIDPQTNLALTDHAVAFSCNRTLNSAAAANAARYARLADTFLRLEQPAAAFVFADRASQLAPLYSPAWDIMATILRQRQDWNACLRLLDRQATVFQRFPDFLVDIRRSQAEILRQLGRHAEAEQLLASAERKVGRDREDLAGSLAVTQVDELLARGDTRGARLKLEELLNSQRREGMKVVGLVEGYLQLTSQTGQQTEALSFLKRYLDRVQLDRQFQPRLQQYLIQAHENAGDQRGADRLRKRQ